MGMITTLQYAMMAHRVYNIRQDGSYTFSIRLQSFVAARI